VPRAKLPNGQLVPPDSYIGGYHGNSTTPPEVALTEAPPAGGSSWDLCQHAQGNPDSAFRGTTQLVYDPVTHDGAAAWAGDGDGFTKSAAFRHEAYSGYLSETSGPRAANAASYQISCDVT
jgi:hypothetical protein